MKLIPASSAAWMIRIDSSWSGLPQAPNIIAPRQSGLTLTPVRPSGRFRRRLSRPRSASAISLTTDAARSASSCDLVAGPVARLAVDHAQRAERVAVGVDQRDAGVGDDAHVADRRGCRCSTGCSRASSTISGSRCATACWQKECDSGVSRSLAHGSASPRQLLKNWRSSSTSETSATGALSTCAASRAWRSKAGSTARVEQPGRAAARRAARGRATAAARVEQRLPALGAVRRRAAPAGAAVRCAPSAASKSASPRWPIA